MLLLGAIKFSEFDFSKKKQIKLNLNKRELNLLERFLEVRSIKTFNCIINIFQLGTDFEINGKISMNCNLQCIISLEDIKYKVYTILLNQKYFQPKYCRIGRSLQLNLALHIPFT